MISVCLQNTDLCVALFADDIRLEQHNICPTFLDLLLSLNMNIIFSVSTSSFCDSMAMCSSQVTYFR